MREVLDVLVDTTEGVDDERGVFRVTDGVDGRRDDGREGR